MVPPICDISFDDNSHGVYLAGQTLAGHVDIVAPKAKKVKSVYLRITGQAYVKWEDSGGTGSSVTYSGRVDYIEHKVVFLSSDSDEIAALKEGSHSYKFSYKLPPTSPTSFEGDFGYIRYTIRIVLERPWKYDLTYKIAFTVVNQLDLNRISPPLNVATVQETMKQYRCRLCRSGPLIMTVSIPMIGYVSGQLILVTVEVMNKSGRDISEIKIKLRRQINYISQTPNEWIKSVFNTLAKYQCSGVGRNRSAGYVRRLLIPPESPSRSTSVIRIEYFVEVVADMSDRRASERVRIPIVIGTVPLANLSRSQEQSSNIDSQPAISGSTTNLPTQFLSSSIQSLKCKITCRDSIKYSNPSIVSLPHSST